MAGYEIICINVGGQSCINPLALRLKDKKVDILVCSVFWTIQYRAKVFNSMKKKKTFTAFCQISTTKQCIIVKYENLMHGL